MCVARGGRSGRRCPPHFGCRQVKSRADPACLGLPNRVSRSRRNHHVADRLEGFTPHTAALLLAVPASAEERSALDDAQRSRVRPWLVVCTRGSGAEAGKRRGDFGPYARPGEVGYRCPVGAARGLHGAVVLGTTRIRTSVKMRCTPPTVHEWRTYGIRWLSTPCFEGARF